MQDKKRYELDDILFIAMKIEKNGEDFYRAVAKRTRNNKIKDLCTRLSNDEKEHGNIFLGIYNELKNSMHDFSCRFLERIPSLAVVADQQAFTDESIHAMLQQATSEASLLDAAHQSEEETIRFYEDLKTVVAEKYASVVDRIIGEEAGHKDKVSQLRQELAV